MSIDGKVIHDDKPNEPIQVNIMRVVMTGNSGFINISANCFERKATDDDGKFHIVTPKTERVIVATVINATTNDRSAAGFAVVDEDEIGLPVELTLKPTVSLSGRLVDMDTGKPYGNRRITIDNARFNTQLIESVQAMTFANNYLTLVDPHNIETQTDENGCFTFDGLPEYCVYNLLVAKTVPQPFEHLNFKRDQMITVGLVDMTLGEDLGDVELFDELLEPKADEYSGYLNQDERPLNEKLNEAKQIAKDKNKRILIMVRFRGTGGLHPDISYWGVENSFIVSYVGASSLLKYLIYDVQNNNALPPDSESAAQRDMELEMLGITGDERRQPMFCILNPDGELVRKAPLIPLMESDEEWEKFFAE